MSQPICAACGKPWHRPVFFCPTPRLAEPEPVAAVNGDDLEDEDECVVPTFAIGDRVRLKGQPVSKYDHGVVVMLEPFEDRAGNAHVQVEATPDRFARHACIESNRLTLIDYSAPLWTHQRAVAECELRPHQHYQVDLAEQCRGKAYGPHSPQTFSALANQLVHCRDAGPDEMSLPELLEWRPGLDWVYGRMLWERDDACGKVVFCRRKAWRRHAHEDLEAILQREVGPYSPDDGVSRIYPWLKTPGANLWAFGQFDNMLPECSGCWCG